MAAPPQPSSEPTQNPPQETDHKQRLAQLSGASYRTPEERDQAVSQVIRVCSVGAAAAAVQPVPMVDLALLTPIQIAMVRSIGNIYGYTLDWKTALGILGTFGLSIAAQNLVLASMKLVPVAGSVAAVPVAYVLTSAIGEASKRYFESGRSLSKARMRQAFRQAYKQQKRTVIAAANDANLATELQHATDAYRSGAIDEAEYTRRKQEIIARL